MTDLRKCRCNICRDIKNQIKRLYKANKYIIGGVSMEYPTAYDLFCYDMVTGQRVRIIREDYEGLRIIVNNQEVYRPYRDLRKL